MVFSFDMVRPRRTATLPSVESWGTNMNIIKDPPKSIFTRRINKVGSDNKLMNTIRAGSDRFAEYVQIYPRGVNPSVSVSYNNTGMTNGTNAMPQAQAHPPYKTMDNGAFRFPAIEGGLGYMLPLSRLNRVATSALTAKQNLQAALANAKCDPPKKTVHKNILKVQQKSAASRNIQAKKIENYKVKHVLSNPVSTFATSNLSAQQYINNNRLNTDKYINKNYQFNSANSNLSGKNINTGHNLPIENYTKDALHGQFNTTKKSFAKKNIEYYEQDLERKLPVYSQPTIKGTQSQLHDNINRDIKLNDILHTTAQVNKTQIKGNNFISRDIKLNPKIKANNRKSLGNYRPQQYWENQLPTLNNLKLNARYSS